MMRNFTAVLISFIFISVNAHAQTSAADSVKQYKQQVKQQKDSLARVNKLAEQKKELARLEIAVAEQKITAKKDAEDAQEAADYNRKRAASLSGDSQDKKSARRAEKSADAAQRSAKKARKSASKVEDLENDIKSLKSRIGKAEELARQSSSTK